MKRIKIALLRLMPLAVLLFTATHCAKEGKPPLLETILDEYISFNELEGGEHYLIANINEAAVKGTSALVLEYRYLGVDDLVLPDTYFKGEYKGVTIYCTVDNVKRSRIFGDNLVFKRIDNEFIDNEWKATNEYFHDIQLVFDERKARIISLMRDTPNGHFERVFRDKGIME